MTQQIKFRGFRTDGKGWVEGEYMGNEIHTKESTQDEWWGYEIHPESLGMFTGLTDKNGKEIYGAIGEKGGDFTESAIFGRATIVWDEYNCAFVPKWHTKGQTASIQHATKHAEIIGNQWEEE